MVIASQTITLFSLVLPKSIYHIFKRIIIQIFDIVMNIRAAIDLNLVIHGLFMEI